MIARYIALEGRTNVRSIPTYVYKMLRIERHSMKREFDLIRCQLRQRKCWLTYVKGKQTDNYLINGNQKRRQSGLIHRVNTCIVLVFAKLLHGSRGPSALINDYDKSECACVCAEEVHAIQYVMIQHWALLNNKNEL